MRLHVPAPLVAGSEFTLPPEATRHAQVRRVQPGDALVLFDGGGSDWPAEVLAVGRNAVRVRVGAAQAVANELPVAVTLALAVPANERMDALVEKATELGVAAIQPLLSERSVLRVQGERAERKREHWQAVAVAACEQCGRARVPQLLPLQPLAAWLAALPAAEDRTRHARAVLSLDANAAPLAALLGPRLSALRTLATLSGPEGGLAPEEESAARARGFEPVALGARVLRADTAPLALLAWLGLAHPLHR